MEEEPTACKAGCCRTSLVFFSTVADAGIRKEGQGSTVPYCSDSGRRGERGEGLSRWMILPTERDEKRSEGSERSGRSGRSEEKT